MHKKAGRNFAAPKQRKRAKRTRKSPKRAKPGAFWVLEGVAAVGGGCGRVRKPGKSREGKAVSTKAWRKWKDGLVSPAGSVGSRQSATGARSPLGTRFWSGCGKAHWGNGGGAVLPGFQRKSGGGRCWFGAMGNFPGQNGRKRAGNPRKNVKYY